jgi:hypothetical protein
MLAHKPEIRETCYYWGIRTSMIHSREVLVCHSSLGRLWRVGTLRGVRLSHWCFFSFSRGHLCVHE